MYQGHGGSLKKETQHDGRWESVNKPWHFWSKMISHEAWDKSFFGQFHRATAFHFRLEITEKQSLSSGQGTADISRDWASESASIQAELSTVYLSKMGAADFFVRRDHRYVALSL